MDSSFRQIAQSVRIDFLRNLHEDRQVSTLIYTMSDKADEILTSFGLNDDDRKIKSTVQ